MELEYIAVVVLLVLVVWLLILRKKTPVNLDGEVEKELPALTLPMRGNAVDYADTEVAGFNPDGADQRWNNNYGVGSGDAPQLSETEIDTPEYKRQMRSLIDYLLRAGYKKKIVNDYVHHIKDKFLSPQLILMQLKNDVNAPPPNISEDPLTG